MKKVLVIIVMIALATHVYAVTPTYRAREVIDGATIKLEDGREVRLMGVAQSDFSEDPAAVEFIRKCVIGGKKYIVLQGDTREEDELKKDVQGRTIGYIFCSLSDIIQRDTIAVSEEEARGFLDLDIGIMGPGKASLRNLSAVLIQEGYAKADRGANFKYKDAFIRFESEAQKNNRGLWAVPMQEDVRRALNTEEEEVLVSGVWFKGATYADPQPAKSKYFKTFEGGFCTSVKGARYWLLADIIKKVPNDLWVMVEYDDPLDPNNPFVEEGPVVAGSKSFRYGSDYIKGLEMYRSYQMKLILYDSKDKKEILDKFTQHIKAYIDTTGDDVLISSPVVEKD